MQLKYKNANAGLLMYMAVFLYIIGVMNNFRLRDNIDNVHLMLCILLPQIMVVIIVVLSLNYVLSDYNRINKAHAFLYRNKITIWKNNIINCIKESAKGTLIVLIGICMYIIIVNAGKPEIYLILAAGGSAFAQLLISFMVIELMEWLFDIRWSGILIIVTMAIGDAFAFKVPLIYRRLYIAGDILNKNSGGIIIKLILAIVILSVIYIAGGVYSKNKEFL